MKTNLDEKVRTEAERRPSDEFGVMFCPKCGHDDLHRELKARHFAGGQLCGGVPAEIRYVLAEARGGWQPIDTAPQDGTLIMLYLAGAPEWNRYTVAVWSEHSKDWHGISASASGVCGWKNPTHWRPLPEPPSEAG